MPELYAGLMSGTSLDGVDAVLADLSIDPSRLLGHRHHAFAPALRNELLALNLPAGDELRRAARAAIDLAREYASVANALLAQCQVNAQSVTAIGCHGQTVRHQPADGYTIQLVNAALLAELTGVTVVCDFRSRDIAAGGQGAPLVPAFHRVAFASPDKHRVIVNIGGIANLTDLPPAVAVTGFDCGPGNLLLDAWTQRHLAQPFDRALSEELRLRSAIWWGRLKARWVCGTEHVWLRALHRPRDSGRVIRNRRWVAYNADKRAWRLRDLAV